MRGEDGKEPAKDRAAIRQVTELIVRFGESRFDELDERGFKVTLGRGDDGLVHTLDPRLFDSGGENSVATIGLG